MRPRGGLNLREASRFKISRAIIAAANVSGEEMTQDVICPNKQQNIVVVSTPKQENADRYSAVRSLTINGMAHEVSAYETVPHGTVKGVIRGVPLTDTIQEINDYIVQDYNPPLCKPTVSARRRRWSSHSTATRSRTTSDTATCWSSVHCIASRSICATGVVASDTGWTFALTPKTGYAVVAA
ncbi:unnamed protein product [Ixodes hexagonus]